MYGRWIIKVITMTPRERMMTALGKGLPDRVPVAPDISNMIPCRLTGKPFWDIYVNGDPPLWKAYLDAVKYFGMDGWFAYGDIHYKIKADIEYESRIIKHKDRWEIRNRIRTPDGDLFTASMYPSSDPPTNVEKVVKDFKEDFRKIRHFYAEVIGYDDTLYQQQKEALGDLGIMCVGGSVPGLHIYFDLFNGNLEAATYAYYDYPELFEELRQMHHKQQIRKTEIALDLGVDSILTGGSGSITMQSPAIWRQLSLPTLKEVTKLCRQAGVISGVHSCGKERYMVEVCVKETDLDYINPLEIPPMGDCDLKECRESYGNEIALMGNLHTTEVMLKGSPELVKKESLKAILAAGINGAFVLSTGDQCGRDTPDENIFAMVETVMEFGHYPLDINRIKDEINKLGAKNGKI
jgi:uroporphyrinogen decarboxylase